ncbi:MAG TPA: POTRA domain-containing protein [Pyrinomonadaceae bacterium]|nr:POTRA domain-containing protein [Pyrinomonadaceae bacterium]
MLRIIVFAAVFAVSFVTSAVGQQRLENRKITAVEITFSDETVDADSSESLRRVAEAALGPSYSATKIHDSIVALHGTGQIAMVEVGATPVGDDGVRIKFIVKRKERVEKISVNIGNTVGDKVSQEDILFKLNLLTSGAAISEQTLRSNSDVILDYLRERGFFGSDVKYTRVARPNSNAVNITFDVVPGTQAVVEKLDVKIDGLTEPLPLDSLSLQTGSEFSRQRLTEDLAKIRAKLKDRNFLAPKLDEPRTTYDRETNKVAISIVGRVGPTVNVEVDAGKVDVGSGTRSRLLPVVREGTLDYAAIIEGERRLKTHFQELGYFFAEVSSTCTIDPPVTDIDATIDQSDSSFVCSVLNSSDLAGRTVTIKYIGSLNRKLNLQRMSIRGTTALTIEDVRTILETQEANLLGIIPLFGYGRGYTSLETLEVDAATIASIMAELGYREAQVRVNQGVAPNGEDLIITFNVEEGPRTFVRNVSISGNSKIDTSELTALLPRLEGTSYSRARFRNAVRKIGERYSQGGFYDARVSFTTTDVARAADAQSAEIDLVFKVENEGSPVVIDRVVVTGNRNVKERAIRRASPLIEGQLLRSANIYSTEQNLFATDAFDKIAIRTKDVGTTDKAERKVAVEIDVVEQPPRLATYGGGYSTDVGASGFFDIRHVNLFGNLWQGGARVRVSQRQQLVQFDFVNPRFLRDGDNRFAPLTISAQYQRDTTVTRFFRSAFDKGTFGIVQRIDADGNPIDEFGNATGSPTIDRITLSAETSRTINRKERSIIFARFRYEDVRLQNVESLLVKDLLQPDARVRISGFGVTYVRDTRENCSRTYTLLEVIATGEIGNECRYNASDPTRGSYLTADYNFSLPQLGANIGFHKFQANYRFFYSLPKFRNLTFAGQAILGLAQVFSSGNRFPNTNLADLNGILPISERFYAGGSNNLRGFDFDEAGPRVVVVPQGTFRNSSGDPVTLDPFTIPFGGNALAVVNLEARLPLTKSIRAVPFYDGGNVFRRIGDIFNPPDVPANDVLRQNLRALWTHTVGLGLRIKTPVGGEFAVDYGYLLNPPRFLIPQTNGSNAIYQLKQGQLHFRFSQAF